MSDANNQEKFNKMLSNSNSILTIIANPEWLTAIAASPTAMNVIASSSVARDIVRNSTTAMSIVNNNSMAIANLVSGLVGLNVADHADMNAVAASSAAMNAIVGSAVALSSIVKSELACRAIEANIQSHRLKVIETLNSSSLFRKESAVQLLVNKDSGYSANRNTRTAEKRGERSFTIYVPTTYYGDSTYGADLIVESLLTGKQLSTLYNKGSKTTTASGIALQGVQLIVVGKYGYVNFDVYIAT
ncbi:hypothetical protein OZD67_03165 [Wolbachia endosymbiont of Drosophila nikananu]|nr:hypothetical protein [Wolbachia endosymbiont of Drosophila nikananu]MDE5061115.1 hypothetical protein [Wolbachia endosymbiont of Drosophila nikananu]